MTTPKITPALLRAMADAQERIEVRNNGDQVEESKPEDEIHCESCDVIVDGPYFDASDTPLCRLCWLEGEKEFLESRNLALLEGLKKAKEALEYQQAWYSQNEPLKKENYPKSRICELNIKALKSISALLSTEAQQKIKIMGNNSPNPETPRESLVPLPCPFCGKPPQFDLDEGGDKSLHQVQCRDLSCAMGHQESVYLWAWNTRARAQDNSQTKDDSLISKESVTEAQGE